MSETVALTGATGFIGGALLRQLASTGNKIRALIRSASTQRQSTRNTTEWIRGNLEDSESLRQLIHGADAIIHCAGAVRGSTAAQFNRTNIEGVRRLVQAATAEPKPPRFLLISSLAAREPHLSPYAASKRQGEKALVETADKLSWTIFRPSAVYGPGDRELLPVFRGIGRGFAPILGSGNGRFSLLFMDDLAQAIIQWLDRGNCRGGTFELHDGHPGGYSWHDVINTVKKLRARPVLSIKIPVAMAKAISAINLVMARTVGYAPMLTPGKVRELNHSNWVGDNTALSQAIGWTPQIKLAEGLRRTLGWNVA
ncbi:MAG: NAD-dependent epimerase/dehydratase family protein [Desulfobacterales bacterium]|nr:NAD-dependent epimerase/dehydratase family protein [Desulfobacterales bacterium]